MAKTSFAALTHEPKPYPEESLRFLLHPAPGIKCEHEVYLMHWSEVTTGAVVLEWNHGLYQIIAARRK